MGQNTENVTIIETSDHLSTDTEARCGLGHACSFCPNDDVCKLNKSRHNKELIHSRLDQIKHVFLVMSNKGGVGKSTVSVNLAARLAQEGFQVGLADADIHGPNTARLCGHQNERMRVTVRGIKPALIKNVTGGGCAKVGSLAFFLSEPDIPVVWRDAYKHDYIHHMLGSFDWGVLDFMIIDMPPGTGNELITLTDLLEGYNTQAIIVTSSDAIALQDSLKATRFCKERGVPILGLVENFTGVECTECGHEIKLYPRAKEFDYFERENIKTLTQLPFLQEIVTGAHSGRPACLDSNGNVSHLFQNITAVCIEIFEENAASELNSSIKQSLGNIDASEDILALLRSESEKLNKGF